MEKSYWASRWLKNKIGFHSPEADEALTSHWHETSAPHGSNVLVPLCGMSPDLDWLAAQGFNVIGVEFVEKACQRFFEERGIVPVVTKKNGFRVYSHQNIQIWNGDFYKLPDAVVQTCSAVYDRAALSAVPGHLRGKYTRKTGHALKAGAMTLLVSLEYDTSVMGGPPFSIEAEEIRGLYGESFTIRELERKDVIHNLRKFRDKGLKKINKVVYLMERKRK